MKDLGISYPVAVDNQYAIWRAFRNQYWPAHYFIDATGRIRHHHFGEGGYAESERVIQQLLKEAGSTRSAMGLTQVDAGACNWPPAWMRSPRPKPIWAMSAPRTSPPPQSRARQDDHVSGAGRAQAEHLGPGRSMDGGAESALLTGPSGRIVYRSRRVTCTWC
jgi:hypothetical protein